MGHLRAFLESGRLFNFLSGSNTLGSSKSPPPPPPPPPASYVAESHHPVSSQLKSDLPQKRNDLLAAIQKGKPVLNEVASGGSIKNNPPKSLAPNILNSRITLIPSDTTVPKATETNFQLKIAEEARKIALAEEAERIKRRAALVGNDETDEGEWSELESDEEKTDESKKFTITSAPTVGETDSTSEHIETLVDYYLDRPKREKLKDYYYETASEKEESYLAALNNFLQNMVEPTKLKVITLDGIKNYFRRKKGFVDQQVSNLEPDTIIKIILQDCFFECEAKEVIPMEFGKQTRGILVYNDAKGEWLTVIPVENNGRVFTMYAYPADARLLTDSVANYIKTRGLVENWAGKDGKFLLISQPKESTVKKLKTEIDAFNALFLDLTEEEKSAFKKPRPPIAKRSTNK